MSQAEASQAVEAAGVLDDLVGESEGVSVARAAPEDEREELVVAESARAKPVQLLARAIVWWHAFHQRYTQIFMTRRGALPCICVATSLLIAGCAEPPSKEMDRAQGAIDAAGAAGAEQYATTEYSAATTALKDANAAVTAGDYRLALNHALESHEHAQNAARDTANTKARMLAEVERARAEVSALIMQGETRIRAAERARAGRPPPAEPAAALAAARAALQKAGEAVSAGDYLGARAALDGVKERVEEALAGIGNPTTSQSSQRRR